MSEQISDSVLPCDESLERIIQLDFGPGGRPASDPAPRQGRLGNLLRELRQRRVCRATMTYALAVWLVLQIADVAFPVLGQPDWVLKLLIALGAAGLPVTVVLAWVFELTPGGLVVDSPRRARARQEGPRDVTVNSTLLLLGIGAAAVLSLPFAIGNAEWLAEQPVRKQRLAIHVLHGGELPGALRSRFDNELRHRLIELNDVVVVDLTLAVRGPALPTVLLAVDVYGQQQAVHVMVRLLDAETGVLLMSRSFEATDATAVGVVDLIVRDVGQILVRAQDPGAAHASVPGETNERPMTAIGQQARSGRVSWTAASTLQSELIVRALGTGSAWPGCAADRSASRR